MKFRNVSMNKKYTNKQIELWAKDMFDGLKHDLKINKKLCKNKPGINDIGEYIESLFIRNFIEWFIDNHFEE